MADLAALREAEALLEHASDLLRRVRSEIAAMEAACSLAEQSIARTEATARQAVEHIGDLGRELRAGRHLQTAVVALLETSAESGAALWGAAMAPALLATPVLASREQAPAEVPALRDSRLPRLRRPAAEELRQLPLPSGAGAAWDLFASEFPAFIDRYEQAATPLDAVEEPARAPDGRRRRRTGDERRPVQREG